VILEELRVRGSKMAFFDLAQRSIMALHPGDTPRPLSEFSLGAGARRRQAAAATAEAAATARAAAVHPRTTFSSAAAAPLSSRRAGVAAMASPDPEGPLRLPPPSAARTSGAPVSPLAPTPLVDEDA